MHCASLFCSVRKKTTLTILLRFLSVLFGRLFFRDDLNASTDTLNSTFSLLYNETMTSRNDGLSSSVCVGDPLSLVMLIIILFRESLVRISMVYEIMHRLVMNYP